MIERNLILSILTISNEINYVCNQCLFVLLMLLLISIRIISENAILINRISIQKFNLRKNRNFIKFESFSFESLATVFNGYQIKYSPFTKSFNVRIVCLITFPGGFLCCQFAVFIFAFYNKQKCKIFTLVHLHTVTLNWM